MQADRIARFLPEIYRAANADGEPLNALLMAMESLQQPSEDILAGLDIYVDAVRAPDTFVPMLASWMDLTPYLDWTGGRTGEGAPRFAPGLDQLRKLIARTPDLNARCGTRAALEGYLEAATGVAGFTVEENPADAQGAPRPFHIRVDAPAAAQRFADLIARIVDRERPAYVTYEITFAPSPARDTATKG